LKKKITFERIDGDVLRFKVELIESDIEAMDVVEFETMILVEDEVDVDIEVESEVLVVDVVLPRSGVVLLLVAVILVVVGIVVEEVVVVGLVEIIEEDEEEVTKILVSFELKDVKK